VGHAVVRHRAKFCGAARSHKDGAAEIRLINDDLGVSWLFSFLSADKKKTYCLYEAPSPDAIREAAKRLNLPADVIVEVDEIRPDQFV